MDPTSKKELSSSSSPPTYNDLFAKRQSEISDNNWNADDKAVILKVASLDEHGKVSNVQWKCGDKEQDELEANWTSSQSGQHHGFGVVVAAMFIVGEMIGGGITAMPNAVCRTGWTGVGIIVLMCIVSGYTGIQLSRCWIILQRRWPEVYLKHTQNPYPEIGYRVGGPWCSRAASLCVNVCLFGTATVFLLMTGRNATQLLKSWTSTDVSFCFYILMAAVVLMPITYFGSPKDFWQVSVGAAGTTTVAVVIMLIGLTQEYGRTKETKVDYPKPDFVSFALGYGTMAFACSGQTCFLTIQHDMKKPEKFPKAVMLSYGIMFCYYIPLSMLGYIVYGSKLNGESILEILPNGWIQDTVTTLITLHVMLACIIYMNPFNQEIERCLKISPDVFTWKRIVVRTATIAFVTFTAESIPAMNLILDLLGGTCMAFLTFVFPPCFYLALRWKTTTHVSAIDKPIRKWEYVLAVIFILIGISGAMASVYAFAQTVITGGNLFKKPCYVNGGF